MAWSSGYFSYAWRRIGRNRRAVALATLTLALAISANTAVFTLIKATVLAPLPVRGASDLITFEFVNTDGRGGTARFTFDEIQRWRDATSGAADLAPHISLPVRLDGRTEVARATAHYVGSSYFRTLGVTLSHGRPFTEAEDRPGSALTAIVTEHFGRTHFPDAPNVVSRTLRINGHVYTIVGVMPAPFVGLSLARPADVFLPLGALAVREGPALGLMVFGGARPGMRQLRFFEAVARLTPGEPAERVAAGARNIIQTTLGPAAPTVRTIPIASAAVGAGARETVHRFSALLIAIVMFVLLLGCANLAGLFLVTREREAREYHIRLALGARRSQVMRLALSEGIAVSMLAGLLALPASLWTLRVLAAFELPGQIRIDTLDLRPDSMVLAFAIGLALLAGIVSTLAPAWLAGRVDLVQGLRGGKDGRRPWRCQSGLLMLQVAVSVVLLFVAGLFVRTVRVSLDAPLGFDPAPLFVAVLDVPRPGYDAPKLQSVVTRLTDDLKTAPQIESASVGAGAFGGVGLSADTLLVNGEERRLEVLVDHVGPAYLETLGVRLIEGRDIAPTDHAGAPRVAVITASLARALWGDTDPVGRQIAIPPDPTARTIVGLAQDTRAADFRERERPTIYVPRWQSGQAVTLPVVLLVRSSLTGGQAATRIRQALAALDRDIVVIDAGTYRERMAAALMPQRLAARFTSGFSLLALLLAAIGVHGLVSARLASRTEEIAVRVTLGARVPQLAGLVIRQGVAPVVLGLGLGLAVIAAGAPLVRTLVFGIQPMDLLACVAASGLLLAAAGLASALCLRFALAQNPATLLRQE